MIRRCIHEKNRFPKIPLDFAVWQIRKILTVIDRRLRPGARNPDTRAPVTKVTMTLLAADTTGNLALDDEIRAIRDMLLVSKYRDLVDLKPHFGVRPEHLQPILLHDEPKNRPFLRSW